MNLLSTRSVEKGNVSKKDQYIPFARAVPEQRYMAFLAAVQCALGRTDLPEAFMELNSSVRRNAGQQESGY